MVKNEIIYRDIFVLSTLSISIQMSNTKEQLWAQMMKQESPPEPQNRKPGEPGEKRPLTSQQEKVRANPDYLQELRRANEAAARTRAAAEY